MTLPVLVPPVAQSVIRGLWVCFWLNLLGVLVWTQLGPGTAAAVRLSPLMVALLLLPTWFMIGRLAAWVRQVSRHASEPQDVRVVARWRAFLLVVYAFTVASTFLDEAGALPIRVGLAISGATMLVCVWRFGGVMTAVQATGTATPPPGAAALTEVLPGWTWTVRAAQAGQVVYALCGDPTYSAAGLASNALLLAATAGVLELLLRFARSRAEVPAA